MGASVKGTGLFWRFKGVQCALWGGLEGRGGDPHTKQDGGRVCREHQTPWSIAKDHRNAGGKRAREQSGRAFSSENWQSFLPLSNWIRAAAPRPGARRAGPGRVLLVQERGEEKCFLNERKLF